MYMYFFIIFLLIFSEFRVPSGVRFYYLNAFQYQATDCTERVLLGIAEGLEPSSHAVISFIYMHYLPYKKIIRYFFLYGINFLYGVSFLFTFNKNSYFKELFCTLFIRVLQPARYPEATKYE